MYVYVYTTICLTNKDWSDFYKGLHNAYDLHELCLL